MLTYGSRGDVQPFLALAVGLQKAGHTVVLALPERLADLARQYGIQPLPLPGDPAALSEGLNRSSHNLVRQILAMQAYVLPIAGQVGRLAQQSIVESELVVHSFLFASGAHTFAQQQGIPDVSAQFFPIFSQTSRFAAIGFPEPTLPPALQALYNSTTHRIGNALFKHLNGSGYRFIRKKNPQWPRKLLWPFDRAPGHPPSPLLFGISPEILPASPDWEAHVHVTGYWFLDEPAYQPPEDLSRFLAGGSPPVCVGFGSMIHPRSTHIQRTLLAALQRESERAVILTGWDGWQPAREEFQNPDFFFLESAPHSWLLPRCKLAIHHGGSGTTAAALRAGVPQWIIPFTADQPFWARRAHQAGTAAAPLNPARVAENTVAPILQAALHSDRLRARAAALGEQIRAEDGVARAVEIIEQAGNSRGETNR